MKLILVAATSPVQIYEKQCKYQFIPISHNHYGKTCEQLNEKYCNFSC